ncbi:hypothetical protein AB8P51_15065 [Muriicola sp. SD30]|uniref:hypothetical protein n=1 Tax=Muriicola sp. SD30 TaxID=3240936 RepID=UPI00350F70EE
MISIRSFLVLLAILFQSACAAQSVDLGYLEGSWLLEESLEDGTLKYQRISPESSPEGSILRISSDSIVDSYQIKCWGGMSTFLSEGSWSLDEKNLVLKSTIPIDLQGQIYKIKELNSESFILAQAKTRK